MVHCVTKIASLFAYLLSKKLFIFKNMKAVGIVKRKVEKGSR
jgi:hypothetical protein